MKIDDIRFLFAFDRWATTKILDAAVGVDEATWSATNIVDERGLGGILVHHLGASQRWRLSASMLQKSAPWPFASSSGRRTTTRWPGYVAPPERSRGTSSGSSTSGKRGRNCGTVS